ncbi:MAG: isoprenylcysteine carboxylmethyltransferase family protein [Alphaproteobacteria bacterium]|nr:isoprenylcysteine carboxylmethyltransferase family protein [Alphaproteobacteria bacterium]
MVSDVTVHESQKRRRFIDPSAIISGVSYFTGCAMAGADSIAEDLLADSLSPVALPLSYFAFFASVMGIQRYMKKSLLAASFGRPQQLVTTGVFAWSRHPIYAAFFIPLLALATVSWTASAAGIVIYLLLMEAFVIRREEAELAELFGEEFIHWKARTRRWL